MTKWALFGAVLVAAISCVTAPEDPRFEERAPDRMAFTSVSPLLESRCGMMDCHGGTARNMRVYSGLGLRLLESDRPSAAAATTSAEVDANYTSVIALEPEVMRRVVDEGGAHPERLTLVRKARGAEQHTGHAPWKEGDDADRCLTSWLVGQLDATLCEQAVSGR